MSPFIKANVINFFLQLLGEESAQVSIAPFPECRTAGASPKHSRGSTVFVSNAELTKLLSTMNPEDINNADLASQIRKRSRSVGMRRNPWVKAKAKGELLAHACTLDAENLYL